MPNYVVVMEVNDRSSSAENVIPGCLHFWLVRYLATWLKRVLKLLHWLLINASW